MKSPHLGSVLAVIALLVMPFVALLASACGGQVAGGDGDAGPGSSGGGADSGSGSSRDGSSTADAPSSQVDAVVTFEASPPVVTCTSNGESGSSGGGSTCDVGASETCTDGSSYSVSCICPQATCTCTETVTQGGSSGGGIPFSGCADSCDPSSLPLAFQACGFPVPSQ